MIGKDKQAAQARFARIYQDGKISGNEIILDLETGVQYLYHRDGYSGGLTPLLGSDGKPIVAEVEIKGE